MSIFISYSRKNKSCVYKVAEALQQNDFDYWIDREGIEITSNWSDRITDAIYNRRIFMLFWSKEASESKFVKAEMDIAYSRIVNSDMKMLTVQLDDTELPPRYAHLQAIPLPQTCTEIQIHNFIESIPNAWRTFSMVKSLNQQPHQPVAETPYVSVLLGVSINEKCRAMIVGNPDETLSSPPSQLAVILQFGQPLNNNIIKDLLSQFNNKNKWYLHIVGPESQVRSGYYGLDNKNASEWEEARYFINEMIGRVASNSITTLQFFTLTPNALFGAICTEYGRFWETQFYNWDAGMYIKVLELPRNRTI